MISKLAKRLCAALAFAPLALSGAYAAPVYTITNSVALGAPDHWDYLNFDPQLKRVYVSHGDTVTVVDGVSGKIVGQVEGVPGSHGMVIVPALHRGAADSAKNQQAVIFDSDTLKPLATAPAGEDADGMTYDAKTGRAFVADGDAGTLSAIDIASGKAVGTVTLGGKPEFLTSDGAGHVYVNSESTRELLVVDANKLAVTARYPIPDCQSPHGLAMDTVTGRLFTSCANAKLFVVDAANGHIVASFDIGKGSDAVAFDPVRKLAFSSNGDGTLSVIAEKGADDFAFLGNVTTLRGARTMTLDPSSGRVYVVTADIDHVDPPKQAGGRPHAVYKPGSMKLYFLDPAK